MTARHILSAVGALTIRASVGTQPTKLQRLTADGIVAEPASADWPWSQKNT